MRRSYAPFGAATQARILGNSHSKASWVTSVLVELTPSASTSASLISGAFRRPARSSQYKDRGIDFRKITRHLTCREHFWAAAAAAISPRLPRFLDLRSRSSDGFFTAVANAYSVAVARWLGNGLRPSILGLVGFPASRNADKQGHYHQSPHVFSFRL